MQFTEHAVDAALGRYVECIWTLSSAGEKPPAEAGLITPDGCVEIVVKLGDAESAVAGGGAHCDWSDVTVLGLTTRPQRVVYGGPIELAGIRLRPAGALRIVGAELVEILDRAAPGAELVPGLARNLRDRARLAPAADRIVSLTHGIGAALAARARSTSPLERATAAIQASAGRISISAVAREIGLSTRQLDRLFERQLGLPPKLLGRIARFRRAFELGLGAQRGAWASIAARCGYADQSHLCREFVALAGHAPEELRTGLASAADV